MIKSQTTTSSLPSKRLEASGRASAAWDANGGGDGGCVGGDCGHRRCDYGGGDSDGRGCGSNRGDGCGSCCGDDIVVVMVVVVMM